LTYTLLGTSTALTITGSVFAIKSRVAHNNMEKACVDGICQSQINGTSTAELLQREKNLALAADINLAVGIIGIGTGLILLNSQSSPNQWAVHNNVLVFQRSF
jgi:hypothetical protein